MNSKSLKYDPSSYDMIQQLFFKARKFFEILVPLIFILTTLTKLLGFRRINPR